MNLKRTMNQALHVSDLTEEAAAFVAAGTARAVAVSTPAPGASPDQDAPLASAAARAVPEPVVESKRGQSGFVHSPLPAERRAPASMTFRLPAELPAALLRVAMERKLRQEEPFTQQDIVAQARGQRWRID